MSTKDTGSVENGHHYERPFPTQFFAHRSQKSSEIENDCGHRIKVTQPNSMTLVSFSFAEDALFNNVKNNTFRSQGTENPPFRFLGHPV